MAGPTINRFRSESMEAEVYQLKVPDACMVWWKHPRLSLWWWLTKTLYWSKQ